MSQHNLNSPRFNSQENQQSEFQKPSRPAAAIDKKHRPYYTATEGELKAIEARAERFVSEGACDRVDRTIDGLLGERAVCELIPGTGEPDTRVHPEGDGGWDIKKDETKINVKSASQETTIPPTLMVSKPLKADCYILANRIDRRTCRLVGFARQENISRKSKYKEGYYDYRVTQEELRPMTWNIPMLF